MSTFAKGTFYLPLPLLMQKLYILRKASFIHLEKNSVIKEYDLWVITNIVNGRCFHLLEKEHRGSTNLNKKNHYTKRSVIWSVAYSKWNTRQCCTNHMKTMLQNNNQFATLPWPIHCSSEGNIPWYQTYDHWQINVVLQIIFCQILNLTPMVNFSFGWFSAVFTQQ